MKSFDVAYYILVPLGVVSCSPWLRLYVDTITELPFTIELCPLSDVTVNLAYFFYLFIY